MNTKLLVTTTFALALALSLGGVAHATTTTIYVDPSDVPDETTPLVCSDAPTGDLGPDSWQNSATGKVNWHARYLSDGDALSLLFGPQAATLTVGEIESISYWTKRPDGTIAGRDWALYIYTRPNGSYGSGDPDADYKSWAGSVILNNYSDHTDTGDWTQYSTDDDMTWNVGSYSHEYSGSDLTLADLQALEGSTGDALGDELVEMISVQTMSNWSGGFDGCMDGLTITLTNGDIGIVNFGSPVPEPASMTLLGLGLAGLGFRRFRKRG